MIHPQEVDADVDEMVERLREASYDAAGLSMSRSLVDDLLRDKPDVVIIRYVSASFDLVRLCNDLRDAIDSRIIVVASHDRSSRGSQREADDAFVVEVLDAGADDFVPSDIAHGVLSARLRVAMRSRPLPERPPHRVILGDVVIDADAHILFVAGEVVKCPPLQFQLLVTLALREGSLVSREALFRELWNIQPDSVDTRRLRIAISGLRRVLRRGPQRPLIESVSGSGYRLSVPPAPVADDAP